MPRWTMRDKVKKVLQDNNFTKYTKLDTFCNPNICTIDIDRDKVEDFTKILQSNRFSFIDVSTTNNENGIPYTRYEIWES